MKAKAKAEAKDKDKAEAEVKVEAKVKAKAKAKAKAKPKAKVKVKAKAKAKVKAKAKAKVPVKAEAKAKVKGTASAGALALDLSFASRRPWVPSSRTFSTWAAAALPANAKRCELSVRVVGRLQSRRLNAAFRNRDKPTNVLSFAGAGIMPDGTRHLGELVICAPLVADEARRQAKQLPAHWAHLTVHGVLHLLGFDHEAEVQAVKMAAREVQILDRLGFSDPYR